MQKRFYKTPGNVAADQTLRPAAPGLMEGDLGWVGGWEMFQYPSMVAIRRGAAMLSSVYFYLWMRSGHILGKESALVASSPPSYLSLLFLFHLRNTWAGLVNLQQALAPQHDSSVSALR